MVVVGEWLGVGRRKAAAWPPLGRPAPRSSSIDRVSPPQSASRNLLNFRPQPASNATGTSNATTRILPNVFSHATQCNGLTFGYECGGREDCVGDCYRDAGLQDGGGSSCSDCDKSPDPGGLRQPARHAS